jgi:hypothetical protein
MIIQAHRLHPELSVQRLCDLFGVSRSWYYEHLHDPGQDEEEIALRDEIEQIILEFPGYGYRRVTRALSRAGRHVNHKRILRIMREEALLCHLKKRFAVRTTDSRHPFPVYPNALAGTVLTMLDQARARRYHLYPLEKCFRVSGSDPGCLLAALCRLASFARDDHIAHPGCLASGYQGTQAAAWIDPS